MIATDPQAYADGGASPTTVVHIMIAIMRSKPPKRLKRARAPTPKPTSKRAPTPKPQPAKQRAKLFWTGRSQAVRLPKEFRFAGEAVFIRRDGPRVILEPDNGWPEGFLEWLETGPWPADFEVPPDLPAEPVDIF